MKPESAAFLRKAHEFLEKANGMLQLWPDEAGRAAYLAAFHAAQALIFEQTDQAAKTHRGVHGQFAHLARDDPEFDPELRAFLGRSYNMKAAADYETGRELQVTWHQASEAVKTAARFVSVVASVLPES